MKDDWYIHVHNLSEIYNVDRYIHLRIIKKSKVKVW